MRTRFALLLCFCAAVPSVPAAAQCPGGSEAEVAAFARANGGEAAFPRPYLEALTAFVRVERALCQHDIAGARSVLDQLWASMPIGGSPWHFDWGVGGTHAGMPPAYYSLRMMDDIVRHELRRDRTPPPDTAEWAVVLAQCAEGVQPRSMAEVRTRTGTRIRRDLAPELRAGDYRMLRSVTDLFRRYAEAMTGGRLAVVMRFHEHAPCVPVTFEQPREGGPVFVSADWGVLYNSGGLAALNEADWIWAIVPSMPPAELPEFQRTEFVTGGMGQHLRGGPLFLSDDRSMLVRPGHLGRGTYSDLERRAYLPQWLQHEFFHHLYLRYPDLRLEAQSHQWFNRTTWPADFTGQFEPDYYAESLHKRLQQASPPLHEALRYAAWTRLAASLRPEDIAGRYQRLPVENGYHDGRITIEDGGRMRWTNAAGVTWPLTPDLGAGRLVTGSGNPYAAAGHTDFTLDMQRGPDRRARLHGFRFQGELYVKQ